MSQIATSKAGAQSRGRGGRCKLPLVFTEHGASQVASVLNSPRAVEVSLYVVRAFVQLRGLLAANEQLAQQLDALETWLSQKLATHDQAISGILNMLLAMMQPADDVPEKTANWLRRADPVSLLHHVMEARALTRKDLEPFIGSRARVAEVLNRVRPVSLTMIRRLSVGLNLPTDLLIAGYELKRVVPVAWQ